MPRKKINSSLHHLLLLHTTVAAVVASSCVSKSDSKSSSSRKTISQSTIKGEDKHDSGLADLLIQQLPEAMSTAEKFESTNLGQRLTSVIGRSLTATDRQTLVSLRALLVAQREIRDQRPTQARELAKVILATENLSTEMYVAALRKLALSDVVELSKTSSPTENTPLPRDPKSEFNSFQNLQCISACKTHGWEVLSREEPSTLSLQGYRTKLLTDAHFRRVGLKTPQWLRNIWSQSAQSPKKEIIVETPFKKADSSLEQVLALRSLVDNRQWSVATSLAKKIISTRKSASTIGPRSKSLCVAEQIYAHYVLAQNSRIQQDRKSFANFQTLLMETLDKSNCRADDFGFDPEQFDSFKIDARLWLARLQWEQNENAKAFYTARRALSEAASVQSWEHFADAAKVLVGRIGFEMLTPAENIAILSYLENHTHVAEMEEFPAWLNTRVGLMHFLGGDFLSSENSFAKVVASTTDNSTRSMAFYWMGRTTRASNNIAGSDTAFLSSGMNDPLSIYDIFSGQILERESGRASTQAKRAFHTGWREAHDSWMKISKDKPLRIMAPTAPRGIALANANSEAEFSLSQKQFDRSLESAMLIFSLLRSLFPDDTGELFLGRARESDELLPLILRAETTGLRQSFARLNTLHSDVLPRAHQIAWLTHSLGDHASSILFVGRLRESLGWDSDYLPFLYFIFYPRPFVDEFNHAATRCSVDVDLLYAVSRQESLFQSAAKSPVGAVGLMQLLPTTAQRVLKQLPEFQNGQPFDLTDPKTNTLAGACYLRDLLGRYNNNLAHAVAAYNAGENAVDKWISRRQKIADMPYFIEFIPFAETKTYVQRVLRNYYNIKWIYQEPPVNSSVR